MRKPRSRPRTGGSAPATSRPTTRREPVIAPVASTEVVTESGHVGPVPTFAELGLPEALVASLGKRGMTAPFAIQVAALPDALAGRDVLGRAETGSGKTLAFGLPMLTRLAGSKASPKRPRGLVLVPTRELALQVNDALEPLGHVLGLRMKVVVGGLSMGKQIDALHRGVDIVIATPGRLMDLIERKSCDLRDVEVTVLDEADHMSDMGFLPVVREILDQVRPGGQRLLFSATLDKMVKTIVDAYLVNAVTHSTSLPTTQVSTMDHHLLLVHPGDKAAVVTEIANRDGRTLLFVRTKHGADRLATQLRRVGVRAGALHGGMTQNARNRSLLHFKDGQTPVLVATDVAARGIHVDGIDLVLHVDPPADPKDYLHRAGRTARAGESGVVVTMVLPDQVRDVERMTRTAGIDIASLKVCPGHSGLVRITGSRTPTGVAVAEPPRELLPQRTHRAAGFGKPAARTGRSTRHRPKH
ncbi:MAG TPA: DEAD/DEAH box helicase [Mycobacteriales bacterium]|nr:DEAD/DEAH box helicase [Mycobacteriales bacterium]